MVIYLVYILSPLLVLVSGQPQCSISSEADTRDLDLDVMLTLTVDIREYHCPTPADLWWINGDVAEMLERHVRLEKNIVLKPSFEMSRERAGEVELYMTCENNTGKMDCTGVRELVLRDGVEPRKSYLTSDDATAVPKVPLSVIILVCELVVIVIVVIVVVIVIKRWSKIRKYIINRRKREKQPRSVYKPTTETSPEKIRYADVDEVKQRHADVDEIKQRHTGLVEVKPECTDMEDVSSGYADLDELRRGHNNLDVENALDEIKPEHYVLDEVKPEHGALDEVKQEQDSLDAVKPEHDSVDEVKPEHDSVDEAKPEHDCLDEVKQEHDSPDDIKQRCLAMSAMNMGFQQ